MRILTNCIRKLRKEKRMKQVALAVETGINQSYLSNIERWHLFPLGDEIRQRIADALETDQMDVWPGLCPYLADLNKEKGGSV